MKISFVCPSFRFEWSLCHFSFSNLLLFQICWFSSSSSFDFTTPMGEGAQFFDRGELLCRKRKRFSFFNLTLLDSFSEAKGSFEETSDDDDYDSNIVELGFRFLPEEKIQIWKVVTLRNKIERASCQVYLHFILFYSPSLPVFNL